MSNLEMEASPHRRTTTVTAEFGNESDIQAILEAIKERIVIALVDKFVEKWGDGILAEIDLETIKKKTSEKVTVAALKELVK